MNKIVTEIKTEAPVFDGIVKDLLCQVNQGWNNEFKETAFIGIVGDNPVVSLYFISYYKIVLVSHPHRAWGTSANVIVKRFVDLEIHVKEK